MKRSILSTAVWVTLLIDRQAWEVFGWNMQEVGFREAVAILIDDQACILDGAVHGVGTWADLYEL